MPTYPLPTLGPTVDANGISIPSYDDVFASLQASMRAIFGQDIYLDADSQDGQQLTIFARAITDSNMGAVAVYNDFSPASAQGAGLSSVVKINGLARLVSSNSTVDVLVVGQPGTLLFNAVIGDNLNLGTQWSLPQSVVIPIAGQITVTATCQADGDVAAAANTLTKILTPTRGWQTVNNPADATPGAPVEKDATLRQRQSVSTAIPSLSVLDGIIAAIANLPGVQRYFAYENDTGAPDANGLPAHSIALVIEGGDAVEIATTIALKKTPGTRTYGTTSEIIIDPKGVPNTISFYVLTVVQLDIVITATALSGYVSTTADAIAATLAAFVSGFAIGEDSYLTRLYAPASLSGAAAIAATGQTQAALSALANTYKITAITQAKHGDVQAGADIAIAFNEAAAAVVANITVTVS